MKDPEEIRDEIRLVKGRLDAIGATVILATVYKVEPTSYNLGIGIACGYTDPRGLYSEPPGDTVIHANWSNGYALVVLNDALEYAEGHKKFIESLKPNPFLTELFKK